MYLNKGNYEIAIKYLEKSLNINNGQLRATTLLSLAQKHLGKEYDGNEINNLIKESKIRFRIHYTFYVRIDVK